MEVSQRRPPDLHQGAEMHLRACLRFHLVALATAAASSQVPTFSYSKVSNSHRPRHVKWPAGRPLYLEDSNKAEGTCPSSVEDLLLRMMTSSGNAALRRHRSVLHYPRSRRAVANSSRRNIPLPLSTIIIAMPPPLALMRTFRSWPSLTLVNYLMTTRCSLLRLEATRMV